MNNFLANRKLIFALLGYHNYHHTFPWDYSASEYGFEYNFNLTTMLIDLFEKCGLAYDLKKPSPKMINSRKERSGDGTENQLIRPQKGQDWAIGLFVTISQLVISLGLRVVVLTIKGLIS